LNTIKEASLLLALALFANHACAEGFDTKANQAQHQQAISDTKIGIQYILTKPMRPSDCKNALLLNKSLITKGELQVIYENINLTNEFNEYCKEQ
jgi:hypothetical protein